jgi:hypothetical protein
LNNEAQKVKHIAVKNHEAKNCLLRDFQQQDGLTCAEPN